MGIGPCILTKVLCAPFMGDAKFVIGWAMVGRAEFAYLIAQMAAAGGMIDEETFSICIWALLYATIFAPFIFRTVLNRYMKRNGFDTQPPAANEHVDEDGGAFMPDHEHQASHASHQSKSQEKAKPDFAANTANPIESSTYGKASADLKDIKLDLEESAPQKLGKDQGKKRETLARTGNGMLCCLFFTKQNMPN